MELVIHQIPLEDVGSHNTTFNRFWNLESIGTLSGCVLVLLRIITMDIITVRIPNTITFGVVLLVVAEGMNKIAVVTFEGYYGNIFLYEIFYWVSIDEYFEIILFSICSSPAQIPSAIHCFLSLHHK